MAVNALTRRPGRCHLSANHAYMVPERGELLLDGRELRESNRRLVMFNRCYRISGQTCVKTVGCISHFRRLFKATRKRQPTSDQRADCVAINFSRLLHARNRHV